MKIIENLLTGPSATSGVQSLIIDGASVTAKAVNKGPWPRVYWGVPNTLKSGKTVTVSFSSKGDENITTDISFSQLSGAARIRATYSLKQTPQWQDTEISFQLERDAVEVFLAFYVQSNEYNAENTLYLRNVQMNVGSEKSGVYLPPRSALTPAQQASMPEQMFVGEVPTGWKFVPSSRFGVVAWCICQTQNQC